MGLLRLAIPAALLLWFLWKARRNALFLLGIPVLMVMRGSVFFENMTPFWKPGRLDPVTLLMIWLVVVWVVTVARRSRSDDAPVTLLGAGRILPEELPLVGIAVLIGVHTAAAFASSGDLATAATQAAGVFYLVLGYVLVRGIASRATRAETAEFLSAVVIANTVACGLFVLHQGLHLPIYLGEANITYRAGGQFITRATTFSPVLNLLAIGFVLAKRRWTPGWMVVLAITLLAILVSLTRTLLLAAVLGLVIAIVARELRRPDFNRFARRIGAIVAASLIVVVGFSRLAPAYWSYLLKRLSEFSAAGGQADQVQNWEVRAVHWDAVVRVVSRIDLLAGAGFARPGWVTVNPDYYNWTSDMTWVPIIYMLGIAGLVLFGLLLAGFMARALSLSLRPPELRRELCLAYFITLALTVVMGFQMWTFMQPTDYPMGLWIFALIAVEALRPAEEPALAAAAESDTRDLVAS